MKSIVPVFRGLIKAVKRFQEKTDEVLFAGDDKTWWLAHVNLVSHVAIQERGVNV